MNSKTSGTFDPYRHLILIVNITDKTNLKRSDKDVDYQILAFSMHGKLWKRHTKTINLRRV